MPTTVSSRSTVGRLITHLRLRRISSKLWLPLEIIVPTNDGVNARTMCQPSIITLRWPFHAELTSTTGPDSRKRRTSSTG